MMEKNFIENYLEWIRKNVFLTKLAEGKWLIETPFLDRHNDYIEIYIISKKNENYLLTDDGYTLSDLKSAGMEISSPKRKELFSTALNGLGIKFSEKTKELYIETDLVEIGKNKHKLMQAMLIVNDMFMLSEPNVATLFKEDVIKYFRKKGIPFNYDVKIVGTSAYEHNIDITLPIIKNRPETFIKVINTPIKSNAELAIFILNDIRQVRKEIKTTIIYNDGEKVQRGFTEAISAYNIQSIAWSNIDSYAKDLLVEKSEDYLFK